MFLKKYSNVFTNNIYPTPSSGGDEVMKFAHVKNWCIWSIYIVQFSYKFFNDCTFLWFLTNYMNEWIEYELQKNQTSLCQSMMKKRRLFYWNDKVQTFSQCITCIFISVLLGMNFKWINCNIKFNIMILFISNLDLFLIQFVYDSYKCQWRILSCENQPKNHRWIIYYFLTWVNDIMTGHTFKKAVSFSFLHKYLNVITFIALVYQELFIVAQKTIKMQQHLWESHNK